MGGLEPGFLENALRAVAKEVPRARGELRAAAAAQADRVAGKAPPGEPGACDEFVPTLVQALESKAPKAIVAALDCLQRLASLGLVSADRRASELGIAAAAAPAPEPAAAGDGDKAGAAARAPAAVTLMDAIVSAICALEDSESKSFVQDDAVQLQVIKALHGVVTSASGGVHETSLLNGVRACYHIFLYARNPVHRSTAKATLTQMMSSVFQQMEVADAKLERAREERKRRRASQTSGTTPRSSSVVKGKSAEEEDEAAETDADADHDSLPASGPVSSAPAAGAAGGAPGVSVGMPLDGSMYSSVASALELARVVPEISLLAAASAPTAPAAKALVADVASGLSTVAAAAAAAAAAAPAIGAPAAAPAANPHAPFRTVQHKDAYLLFRALCKLSMKNQNLVDGDGANGHQPDPVALRSKVLSLDLIQGILEGCGPAFRGSKDFVYAIKTYLCNSLIKNCVSTNTQVVVFSLRIFVALFSRFARHLKTEIELVISRIFLPILESSNSPHEHKVLVMEVLMQICREPENLFSIFFNYDCDLDSIDLYARIVRLLSKVASSETAPVSPQAPLPEEQQKAQLHLMALRSVVSVLQSLADFSAAPGEEPAAAAQVAATDDAAAVTHVVPQSPAGAEPEPPSPRDGASISNTSALSSRRLKVDSFQQKQKFQRDIENAASKFSIKPKRGIAYLVEQGYINHTPGDVAMVLLQFKEELSKTMIGDFLGEDADFNVRTLHCYVDQFSFVDMLIDEALRTFLSGFRLPGEAQKIDRMMEKFAAKYLQDNPGSFPSADTAFVLSFSVIMLQTDLHNPNIAPEKKMTKKGFLANNRGIAGGRDLDPDFLGGIYDRIKATPISLKEDERDAAKAERSKQRPAAGGLFGSAREANTRRQRAAFSREREEIVENATSLLGSRRAAAAPEAARPAGAAAATGATGTLSAAASRLGAFFKRGEKGKEAEDGVEQQRAQHQHQQDELEPPRGDDPRASGDEDGTFQYYSNDHVAPMFAVTWAPFCAVFSVNMRTTEDQSVWQLCVAGVKAALHVACRFGLEDERTTLFDALIKFTLLNAPAQEMRSKHVECVRALVEVVQQEGDFLGASWEPALACFSQLARMQLFTQGGSEDKGSPLSPAPGPEPRAPSRPGAPATQQAAAIARRRSGGVGPGELAGEADKPGGLAAAPAAILAYFAAAPSAEDQARHVDEANARLLLRAVDMIAIDRIFLDSTNLGTSAIIDMVNALCAVSATELGMSMSAGGGSGGSAPGAAVASGSSQKEVGSASSVLLGRVDRQPRTFALQKVVEVADSNMESRPRFVWGRIWGVLSRHFTAAGCHPAVQISMYAVDSLRQLSVKFLEKDEMAGFNFQLQFMEPFEDMMLRSSSPDLRDLVLRCVENIILSRSPHLRSGWRVVLNVVCVGGGDRSKEVTALAFALLERVVRDHLAALEPYFDELVTSMLAFATNGVSDASLSFKAQGLLEATLDELLGLDVGQQREQGSRLQAEKDRHRLGADDPFAPVPASPGEEHQSNGGRSPRAAPALGAGGPGAASLRAIKPGLSGLPFEDRLTRFWPLLRAFVGLVGDSRPAVRAKALAALFDRLESCVAAFPPSVWALVFQRCFVPMFANLKRNARLCTKHVCRRMQEREALAEQAAQDALTAVQALLAAADGAGSGGAGSGGAGSVGAPSPSGSSAAAAQAAAGKARREAALQREPAPLLLEVLVEEHAATFSATTLYSILTRINDLANELLRRAAAADEWAKAMSAVYERTVLRPVLGLLEWLCLTDSEYIASSGVNMLARLVHGGALFYTETHWGCVVVTLTVVARDSTPFFLTDDRTRVWLGLEPSNGSAGAGSGQRSPAAASRGSASTMLEDQQFEDGLEDADGLDEQGADDLDAPSIFSYPRARQGDALPFHPVTAFTMCSVQLQILKLSGDIVPLALAKLREREVMAVLATMRASVQFARDFNDDLSLREALQRRGFMDGPPLARRNSLTSVTAAVAQPAHDGGPLPTLLRQETLALSKYLSLLFRLDSEVSKPEPTRVTVIAADGAREVRRLLEQSLHQLLMHYLFQDRMLSAEYDRENRPTLPTGHARRDSHAAAHEESEAEVDLRFFTPVVLLALREVLEWDTATSVRTNLPWLFPLLTALLDCGNREVHAALRKIFEQKISTLLGLDKVSSERASER